jgi:hypothetical protein
MASLHSLAFFCVLCVFALKLSNHQGSSSFTPAARRTFHATPVE